MQEDEERARRKKERKKEKNKQEGKKEEEKREGETKKREELPQDMALMQTSVCQACPPTR